jgi:plasmid stabilization system protein ParE
MRLRYTPRARSDLQAILQYIDQRSPLGARKVKRAIQKTIELIGEFPEAGRRSGERGRRVPPAGRYPYLIYWTIKAARCGFSMFVTRVGGRGNVTSDGLLAELRHSPLLALH